MSAKLLTLLQEAAALQQRGALRDAERRYEAVLKADPGEFNALHLLGVLRIQQGRPADGARLIGRALARNPRSADARSNLANALLALGRDEEAATACREAIALKPAYAEAHDALGLALQRLGRREEALACHRRALECNPGLATAHSNLGLIAESEGDLEAAAAHYERAVALRPEFADAWSNLGNTHKARGDFDRALACYERALAAVPDHAQARFNASVTHLLRGELDRGVAESEWRRRLPGGEPARPRPGRSWLGETDPRGKTVLVHEEQGHGDTIQFVRYVPALVDAGARVVLEVVASLVPLVRTLQGGATVVPAGSPVGRIDLHCPVMSLPHALASRVHGIPAEVPYLQALPERLPRWQALLGPRRGLRVGLAWSGSRAHKDDRNRSIALARLASALAVPGVECFALQPDVRDEDRAALRSTPGLRDLGPGLADFADTACAIELLDLVISVDTSVAHLAGALGKPVWILVPFAPDWRWQLGRSDSPWYPTAELFRQPRPGAWDPVIETVRERLALRAT